MEWKSASSAGRGIEVTEKGGVVQIEAVFATLNVKDHDGDVTVPGAFENGAPVRMSAFNHTSWSGALPVGKGRIYEEGNEVIFRGEFFNTQAAQDTRETVKGLGELAEFSYGFDTLGSERGEFQGEQVRFLTNLKTHEVSPVLKGAGIGTRLLAIKEYGSGIAYPEPAVSSHQGGIAGMYTPRTRDTLDTHTRLELSALKARFESDQRAEHAKLVALARRFYGDLERAALIEEMKGLAVAAGALFGYRMVCEADVPAETHRAVQDAVLKRDPRVSVGWFVSEHDPKQVDFTDPVAMGGFCYAQAEPDRIWVRADVNAEQAWGYAHHELAHLLDGADEEQAQLAGMRAMFECRGSCDEQRPEYRTGLG